MVGLVWHLDQQNLVHQSVLSLRSYLHTLEGTTTDDATRKARAFLEYKKQVCIAILKKGVYEHFPLSEAITEQVRFTTDRENVQSQLMCSIRN